MNISTPFRNSYLDTSTYNPNPNDNLQLDYLFVEKESLSPRPKFKAIDYAEYKAKCDVSRITMTPIDSFSPTAGPRPEPKYTGFGNR